jgi:hypothetical protein
MMEALCTHVVRECVRPFGVVVHREFHANNEAVSMIIDGEVRNLQSYWAVAGQRYPPLATTNVKKRKRYAPRSAPEEHIEPGEDLILILRQVPTRDTAIEAFSTGDYAAALSDPVAFHLPSFAGQPRRATARFSGLARPAMWQLVPAVHRMAGERECWERLGFWHIGVCRDGAGVYDPGETNGAALSRGQCEAWQASKLLHVSFAPVWVEGHEHDELSSSAALSTLLPSTPPTPSIVARPAATPDEISAIRELMDEVSVNTDALKVECTAIPFATGSISLSGGNTVQPMEVKTVFVRMQKSAALLCDISDRCSHLSTPPDLDSDIGKVADCFAQVVRPAITEAYMCCIGGIDSLRASAQDQVVSGEEDTVPTPLIDRASLIAKLVALLSVSVRVKDALSDPCVGVCIGDGEAWGDHIRDLGDRIAWMEEMAASLKDDPSAPGSGAVDGGAPAWVAVGERFLAAVMTRVPSIEDESPPSDNGDAIVAVRDAVGWCVVTYASQKNWGGLIGNPTWERITDSLLEITFRCAEASVKRLEAAANSTPTHQDESLPESWPYIKWYERVAVAEVRAREWITQFESQLSVSHGAMSLAMIGKPFVLVTRVETAMGGAISVAFPSSSGHVSQSSLTAPKPIRPRGIRDAALRKKHIKDIEEIDALSKAVKGLFDGIQEYSSDFTTLEDDADETDIDSMQFLLRIVSGRIEAVSNRIFTVQRIQSRGLLDDDKYLDTLAARLHDVMYQGYRVREWLYVILRQFPTPPPITSIALGGGVHLHAAPGSGHRAKINWEGIRRAVVEYYLDVPYI